MSGGEPTSLKRAALGGVVWKITAEAVTQITRVVLLLVLARLLTPSDFGVASIVLAFVLFVPVLADLGLGAALIQRREITEVERSSVFWASIVLGTTFFLVGVGLSWPLADIFDEQSLQPLFSAFSVSFVLASLSSVPNALLMRAMNFRALEIRVIISTLIGATCALVLALLGFGPWAIVGGEIANRTASLVLLWSLCAWRPRLLFSWPRLRSMLAFSSGILGGHLLLQFAQTIQNLMVGRLLGAQALGRLTVSQTLVLLPFSRVAAPIQEVLFPTFSRMQDEPARILHAWNRVNQVTAGIALPALFGLAILAPEFTDVVLGNRWQGTDEVIRALALSGIAVALQRLSMGVLAAMAYYRSLVWIGLAAVGLVATAIAIGSQWGLAATAFALSIQALLIQCIVMATAARSVGARLRDVLTPLVRIAIAAGIMAVVVVAAVELMRVAEAGSAVILVCGMLVGAIVYLPLAAKLEPELVAELVGFFRARRATPRAPGAEAAAAGATKGRP